ncbi:raftlin-2 isoform X2 [Callorhinchus milii]|uniref:Raftlin family member 2 n=1 Tax=Callorhinchus milii TaxID=7868 RepID=A0A4W3IQ19_CALMI|nr:raftlin-2 isoform X2 [Callorhinchus milii]
MGCGLRKLEEPDDSSPGKIFSTLKRSQVETKTNISYEYLLLDFTLESGSPNPDVIKISSFLDLNSKLEEYYRNGYIVATIHPTIISVGRRKQSPLSYIYRVILTKQKSGIKKAQRGDQRQYKLVVEEWSVNNQALSNEVVKSLLDKVKESVKEGKKFIGFLSQHSFLKPLNGTKLSAETDRESGQDFKLPNQGKYNPDENHIKYFEGTLTRQPAEGPVEEHHCHKPTGTLENGPSPEEDVSEKEKEMGEKSCSVKRKEEIKLFAVFNVSDEDCSRRSYHGSDISLRVTRKGQTICSLEADWLEITASYHKSGMSLIDSFITWETKGDYLSKSVEGLFMYEEGDSGSNKLPNDAIVVEQWTVIEDCEVKSDYGPLLHTLAEFGWLITCVLATPIIRHDSEGNLATKQVIFLQRPAALDLKVETNEKKNSRSAKSDEKGRHVGVDTSKNKPLEANSTEDSCSVSKESLWAKEPSQHYGDFSGLESALRDLDDAQLDQEDEANQILFYVNN